MATNEYQFTDLSSGATSYAVQHRSNTNINTQGERYNENSNETKASRRSKRIKNLIIALALVLSVIALILAIVLPLTLRSQTTISTRTQGDINIKSDRSSRELAAPTCNDSLQDQDETDVDCGGQTCSPCGNNKKCRLNRDCASKSCGSANICVVPTCSDYIQNQDETDIDCGGKNCTTSKCSFQKMCAVNGDCKSKKCSSSKCQACSPQLQTEKIALTVNNSGSLAATAGDLNNDGIVDLIGVNSNFDSISVLFGNGDGSFQNSTNYLTAPIPSYVELADFDRNGIVDIAVACRNYNNGTLSILIGLGNGSFKSVVNYNSADGDLISLSVVDFNNDSYLDIIATSYNGSNVQIFFGNGDGTFITPPFIYMMPAGVAVRKVVTGYFNKDSLIDFAVSNSNTTGNEVAAFLGGIGGTVMVPPRYYSRGLSSNSPSICAIDINQDNNIDLVVANYDTNTLSIFYGDGQGSFQVTPTILTLYGNQGPRSIASADFNLDNIPDLAISFSVSNVVMILLGTGGGSMTSAGTYSMNSANGSPHLIYATDLNGDGLIDVVFGDNAANNIGIFLNSCT